MMEHVNSGTPFVSVVEYGKETFVNIRQLCGENENIQQQGVVVSLKQFSLLMYHLKAIEASLVEGKKENVKKETNEFISTLMDGSASSSSIISDIDYSKTSTSMLTNVNVNDLTNKTEFKSYGEMGAAINNIPNVEAVVDSECNETNLPMQRKRVDNATTEYEAKLPKQRKRPMMITPIKTVREELMQIYCEMFEEQFPNMIMKKCSGCYFNSNQREEHNVCKLMLRKERIEVCFYDIVNEWSDQILREKLRNRMWNNVLPYNEEKMYIPKAELLQNNKWVAKFKSMIEKQ